MRERKVTKIERKKRKSKKRTDKQEEQKEVHSTTSLCLTSGTLTQGIFAKLFLNLMAFCASAS